PADARRSCELASLLRRFAHRLVCTGAAIPGPRTLACSRQLAPAPPPLTASCDGRLPDVIVEDFWKPVNAATTRPPADRRKTGYAFVRAATIVRRA
ncbi:MAG TPA: hypothetical protein VEZ15_01225, partial [Acidimicrobiia bacterium]|nr:hypothetical protein [Acidimicrobiia bacterium]